MRLGVKIGPIDKGRAIDHLVEAVIRCLESGDASAAWKEAEERAAAGPPLRLVKGSVKAPGRAALESIADFSDVPEDVLRAAEACPHVQPVEHWADLVEQLGLGGTQSESKEERQNSDTEPSKASTADGSERDEDDEDNNDQGNGEGEQEPVHHTSGRGHSGPSQLAMELLWAMQEALPGTDVVVGADATPDHPRLAKLPRLRAVIQHLHGRLSSLRNELRVRCKCNVDALPHNHLGILVRPRGVRTGNKEGYHDYYYVGRKQVRSSTEMARALAARLLPKAANATHSGAGSQQCGTGDTASHSGASSSTNGQSDGQLEEVAAGPEAGPSGKRHLPHADNGQAANAKRQKRETGAQGAAAGFQQALALSRQLPEPAGPTSKRPSAPPAGLPDLLLENDQLSVEGAEQMVVTVAGLLHALGQSGAEPELWRRFKERYSATPAGLRELAYDYSELQVAVEAQGFHPVYVLDVLRNTFQLEV